MVQATEPQQPGLYQRFLIWSYSNVVPTVLFKLKGAIIRPVFGKRALVAAWDMERGGENCMGGFRKCLGRYSNQSNKRSRAKQGWIQRTVEVSVADTGGLSWNLLNPWKYLLRKQSHWSTSEPLWVHCICQFAGLAWVRGLELRLASPRLEALYWLNNKCRNSFYWTHGTTDVKLYWSLSARWTLAMEVLRPTVVLGSTLSSLLTPTRCVGIALRALPLEQRTWFNPWLYH